MTMREIPELDRPYEKYLKYGEKVLSDSELLAIVLKTGTRKVNCLELSKTLLGKHESGLEGFNYLANASLAELMQHSGIGRVKAIQIKALIELALRISNRDRIIKKIGSPLDVYNVLSQEMSFLEKEEIRIVILDVKNVIKSVVTLAKGSINSSAISIKEVLAEPIKQLASGIILVHNHPSGDSTPSKQDILLTKKLVEYSNLFDIDLKDHIVIGKNQYTSIREQEPSIFLRGKLL